MGGGYVFRYSPPRPARESAFPWSPGHVERKWPGLPQYRQHRSLIRRSLSAWEMRPTCMGSGGASEDKGGDSELEPIGAGPASATDMPIYVRCRQGNATAKPKGSRETSANYNLLIDYQFTFSLLQEDDHHYTAINFMATPEQSNKNLDMSINASNNFNLNITWSIGSTAGTISGEEVPIVSKTNIQEHRDSFSCEKFNFRVNSNITFYVYVSNFSWPIKIQIAFSQHNSIMDLVQFFVTFFRYVPFRWN
ncbi:hypothetical protein J4Q44_G00005980 [Coregonus suidteri]|uniref:Attractin GBD domain-containing protein n=1 Tax=Coregonus suidteri TaxID=861788 RepID=A0AAN8MD41_9TELE